MSGNLRLHRQPVVEEEKPKHEFEEEVLKKLGGSVAFVRGKKLVEG